MPIEKPNRLNRLQDGGEAADANGAASGMHDATSEGWAHPDDDDAGRTLPSTPADDEQLIRHMPWLTALAAEPDPWATLVLAHAEIALHAQNDQVAEQGAEEALRMLHKYAAAWAPASLVAAFTCAHRALFLGDLVGADGGGRAAQLVPARLERTLARVRLYLPSLWTLLVTEYGTLGAPALTQLLDTLLCLLRVDSMEAVDVGVSALHQMSIVLGGQGGAELDAAGWDALVDMLNSACSMDTARGVALRQGLQTVVMVQRSIAQILQHCGRGMPPGAHLRLLRVLRESVDRACAALHPDVAAAGGANGAAHRAEDALASPTGAREINGHAGQPNGRYVPPGHPSTSKAQRPLAGVESDIQTRHGNADAGTGSLSVPSTPPERQTVADLRLEQQNQGGRLLVKAYSATVAEFRASAQRHASLVEAAGCAAQAEEALMAICRAVVASCGAVCRGAAQTAGTPWSAEANGEVLSVALRALVQQPGGRGAVLPELCWLIRCDGPGVREEVAKVYDDIVFPQVLATLDEAVR
jgi:hypothetical protein